MNREAAPHTSAENPPIYTNGSASDGHNSRGLAKKASTRGTNPDQFQNSDVFPSKQQNLPQENLAKVVPSINGHNLKSEQEQSLLTKKVIENYQNRFEKLVVSFGYTVLNSEQMRAYLTEELAEVTRESAQFGVNTRFEYRFQGVGALSGQKHMFGSPTGFGWQVWIEHSDQQTITICFNTYRRGGELEGSPVSVSWDSPNDLPFLSASLLAVAASEVS